MNGGIENAIFSKSLSLSEHYEPTLEPIFALKPAFSFSDGIFSPLERIIHENKGIDSITVHGLRNKDFYESDLKESINQEIVITIKKKKKSIKKPEEIINNFGIQLEKDIDFLEPDAYSQKNLKFCEIKGDVEKIWIDPQAKISKLCEFDTRKGDIVIEKGVEISSFSTLRGPLYIGEGSQMNRVNISHSRIGKVCRIGGEVTHSIIGNFTNKNHEGFLGHSIVGDWVNLGALTTTSNLKSNYEVVHLEYQGKKYDTGVQKFGSIIGDFSKTSIGTMLTTGSILDIGCLLFGNRQPQKYYPPFFWGGDQPTIYRLERFIRDIRHIMGRRKQRPSEYLIQLIRKKYATVNHPAEN